MNPKSFFDPKCTWESSLTLALAQLVFSIVSSIELTHHIIQILDDKQCYLTSYCMCWWVGWLRQWSSTTRRWRWWRWWCCTPWRRSGTSQPCNLSWQDPSGHCPPACLTEDLWQMRIPAPPPHRAASAPAWGRGWVCPFPISFWMNVLWFHSDSATRSNK